MPDSRLYYTINDDGIWLGCVDEGETDKIDAPEHWQVNLGFFPSVAGASRAWTSHLHERHGGELRDPDVWRKLALEANAKAVALMQERDDLAAALDAVAAGGSKRAGGGAVMEHYTVTAAWSEEDGEYVATCQEFEFLSWQEPTRAAAVAGFERLLEDVVADLEAHGEPVPRPKIPA